MVMRKSLWLFYDLRGLADRMARSRHQTGTIEQRNGTWYARPWRLVLQPDGTLKRKRTREPLGPAKAGAKEPDTQIKKAFAKLMAEVNARESQPVALMPFKDYYAGPYQMHLETTSRNNRVVVDSIMRNHILPAIGDLSFPQISSDRIKQLIHLKKGQLSPIMVKHIRAGISGVWHHARQHGVIELSNPAEYVKLPRLRRVRPHQALSPEQVAYGINRLPLLLQIMSLLGCCNSLGPAELTGLRWRRLNLSDTEVFSDGQRLPPRSVWIIENWTRQESKETKNEFRDRILPIPDLILPMLLEWRRQSKFTQPDDYVFAAQKSKQGMPIDANKINKKHLKDLSRRLEVRVTWYSFRHTFATLFEMAGGRQFEKKVLMGHSRNADQTDAYTHVPYERLREIVNRIAGLIAVELTKTDTPEKVRMIR